jgi:hypothetical protein
MQVGYGSWRKRLSLLCKQLLVATGLIVTPGTASLGKLAYSSPALNPSQPHALPQPDARTIRLKNFLRRLHCPVENLAEDFVQAADDNHLDWRLLPSISVIESGGGKAYRNNNLFGWNQGSAAFPSIRAGLHLVAFRLGHSSLYRDRDSAGKLRVYNPDSTYPGRVLQVMNRISPVPDLSAAQRNWNRQNAYVYE